ncbi:MAG: alpha/beta fold hydrolase [Betaproteobacteria bacterium]|nr:alpha/beta fold hydrolase [Betaproteobacteria bacterium]
MQPLEPLLLPAGIRARFVPAINGLTVHVLEAGFETSGRPCLLLLHGFPELAYSWRKVMPALAAAGYHVIAPDQRGCGRTTGWDDNYDTDLAPFRMVSMVRDALALVAAFGYRSVAGVIGHDFGSPVAAWCALARPDVFSSVVLMSAPFAGPPALPFDMLAGAPQPVSPRELIGRALDDLARLPRPRKHYQWYYSTRAANADMLHCPQGLHDFLRAYYHCKSADWKENQPCRLEGWTAAALAKLPTYYVMDRDRDMPATVAAEMPSRAAIAACRWLPDNELAVYSAEYGRTGFQGGLQWYRCATDPAGGTDLQLFAGRTIDVPSCFIAGASDWGVFQAPGAFETMQDRVCTRMLGCHLIDGAGHWVQQERADAVSALLLEFLPRALSAAQRTAPDA